MTGTTCFWCNVDPRKEMPNGISPHSTWCPQYRRPPSAAQVLKQFDDMAREIKEPNMLSKDEHKKLLRDADESVLPRRKDETDEAYGKRMYEHLNGAAHQRS